MFYIHLERLTANFEIIHIFYLLILEIFIKILIKNKISLKYLRSCS